MAQSKTSKTLPSLNEKPYTQPVAGDTNTAAKLQDAKKSTIKKVKIGRAPIDIDFVATPENTGLALALEMESRNGDLLLGSMHSLKYSPMFRIAVINSGVDKKAIEALNLPIDSDDTSDLVSDNTFSVRLLCAQMLLAGRLIERNAANELQA